MDDETPVDVTTRTERPPVSGLITRLARSVRDAAALQRTDALWPSHPAIFRTNPMSLAYGAVGTALFLKEAEGAISVEVGNWLERQVFSPTSYPPGYLVGLAGIWYGLRQVGMMAKAEEAFEGCRASPLLEAEASLFYGAAGCGAVALRSHFETGDTRYASLAEEALAIVMRSAQHDDAGAWWASSIDKNIHYGVGFGSAGIGLFLLLAGQAMGDRTAVALAERALAYDVAHRYEDAHGWTWFPHSGSQRTLPFWLEGAAGIGAVALRFWIALGDEQYLEIARTIASAVAIRWASLPSLLEGLAGIGDFLIDMYLATGETEYLLHASNAGTAVRWYFVERGDRVLFPGRFMDRASCDLASGAAGVGLFLLRLDRQGPSPLAGAFDFPFPMLTRRAVLAPS